jgi:hypothetical protein
MGGIYGRSRASKLNQDGRYHDAVAEATLALERDPGDATALVDRATARAALGEHAAAAADLEAALAADDASGEIDADAVDDAYFSALLAVARAAADPREGADGLARYREVLPGGSHAADVTEWQRRIRGEIPPALIIKERD